MNQKPELKEVKSALDIPEWVLFMKDEYNSLEEEKRFLITQTIALITTIVILIWVLVQLFINQISFDIGTNDKIIFEFKITFASLILVFSFQIYKIISLLYAITLDDQILRIINVTTRNPSYVNIFPIIFIFIIILGQGLSLWIFAMPTIAPEIIRSIAYRSLLFISGLETTMAISAIIWERKLSKMIEETQFDKKKLSISLAGGIIYQFFIFLLIVWVLLKLERPPFELIEIQLEFGLVIISIFFILIYWAKPLYFWLKQIAVRVEQLGILIDKAIHGEISAEGIILQRDELRIY